MRRQKAGRIVNISAVGAFLGSVCAHPAYGVSKAGLIAMTKSSVRPNSFVKFAHFVIPITEYNRFYVNFYIMLTSRVKPIRPREILANMALTEDK